VIEQWLLRDSVYVAVMVLLAIGLYGMLAQPNLAKKLVGMVIFQSAVYLFFIQGAAKRAGSGPASVPIISAKLGSDAQAYVNPLPHLLILTALVVGVAVLGVALAFLLRIHRRHGTFDEAAILSALSTHTARGHRLGDSTAHDDGHGRQPPDAHDSQPPDGNDSQPPDGHDSQPSDGRSGQGDDGPAQNGGAPS
jgi:multicomponent Na+:H+ antiporter subunit C